MSTSTDDGASVGAVVVIVRKILTCDIFLFSSNSIMFYVGFSLIGLVTRFLTEH